MLRKIVVIDEDMCDGCGLCISSCHENALQIIDGKARLVADHYCDGLGDCLGECPRGAITVEERDVAAYDEAAVQARAAALATPQATPQRAPTALTGGCPGAAMRKLNAQGGCPGSAARALAPSSTGGTAATDDIASSLGHWPIQLRLISPQATFLAGAQVLLTADCVPAAVPSFHQRFLSGKVLMLACPKLDDGQQIVQRLSDILCYAGIASLTVLYMEVPCCGGLLHTAMAARQQSGSSIPLLSRKIGIDGRVHPEQELLPGRK